MPRFGRVANPQKVEKISEKNMKNVTKISWQPWQTKELADSSANVDCIGYINLPSATFLLLGTNSVQVNILTTQF